MSCWRLSVRKQWGWISLEQANKTRRARSARPARPARRSPLALLSLTSRMSTYTLPLNSRTVTRRVLLSATYSSPSAFSSTRVGSGVSSVDVDVRGFCCQLAPCRLKLGRDTGGSGPGRVAKGGALETIGARRRARQQQGGKTGVQERSTHLAVRRRVLGRALLLPR